jgi:hypothetical protein
MNINAKIFTSAVAITLCVSGVLTTNAFASQSDNNQGSNLPDSQKLAQYYQNNRNQNDFNNYYRSNNRNARNYHNRPRSFNRLPNGYRKYVSQNRTYYTQDNQAYYSYNSGSKSYVLIRLPGISIFF